MSLYAYCILTGGKRVACNLLQRERESEKVREWDGQEDCGPNTHTHARVSVRIQNTENVCEHPAVKMCRMTNCCACAVLNIGVTTRMVGRCISRTASIHRSALAALEIVGGGGWGFFCYTIRKKICYLLVMFCCRPPRFGECGGCTASCQIHCMQRHARTRTMNNFSRVRLVGNTVPEIILAHAASISQRRTLS